MLLSYNIFSLSLWICHFHDKRIKKQNYIEHTKIFLVEKMEYEREIHKISVYLSML